MNFFHSLFKSKLDAMRAAAPRATIHALHESNGFSIYLDEATAVRKVTQLGTFTDHAEDVLLDDPVPVLFIPLEQAVRFTEEVTAHHSVALVDVILADKVHAARYVMYAYFAKKVITFQDHVADLISTTKLDQVLVTGGNHDPFKFGPEERRFLVKPISAATEAKANHPEEKDSTDADFWG